MSLRSSIYPVLTQYSLPVKWGLFTHVSRTLVYITLFVGIALLIAWFYRVQAMHELMQLEESKNISLTTLLKNTTWSEFSPLMNVPPRTSAGELWDQARIERLHAALLSQLKGLSVIQVKIDSPQGTTIFSTDISQIGQDKSDNQAFLSALAGEPTTVVIDQGHLNVFGDNAFNAGIIASYIPLRDKDATGEIVGVFEVYNDVTDFIFQIQHTARKLSISIAISLAILYLFFFRLLHHGKGKSPIPYLGPPMSKP